MDNILFRNSLIKEIKNFNTSSFFKLHEVPNNGYVKDIDTRIHETLEGLNNVEVNSITIPISITENFLEFSGLRLAHHIRLSPNLSFRKTPIIIMGSLNEKQLLKLSSLANILLTPNVFYVNLSKYAFDTIEKSVKKLELSDGLSFDFNKYLDKVTINPPENYQSHHSIDNELCLLRWSEFLGISEQISEVKNNLQSNLYFKYVNIINPIKVVQKGNPYFFSDNAKILLIDDQFDKGWEPFYKAFFELSKHQIKLETLDIDFQMMNSYDIIENAKRKIRNFDPDIVLLDLRLSDSDLYNDPENLTGNKILKDIKLFNKGVQVIIITASNKVWNYEVSLDFGCNGFIVKNSKNNVSEDIKNLKLKINLCINRASYLKQAFKSLNNSFAFIDEAIKNEVIEKPFGNELIKYMEIALVMFERAKTKDSFAYSYLSLFKCLELIVGNLVYEERNNWFIKEGEELKQLFWDKNLKKYLFNNVTEFRNNTPSTFEKSAGLCKQLWSYDNEDIRQIYFSIDRRNKFIHPPNEKLNSFVQSNLNKIFIKEGFMLLLNQIEEMISNFNLD
ncbi:response regulator [Psychroserpens sp. NJDZ02]|uniref:response regulator n=1 Tax=Psychroserpens sp. NJDZ02 TaxID=2570561 RepID=UPI0010A7803F|nr:response regulator [Psychroserpens sp. NJDZ02]QCE42397.1 response regulator [Psychroserpens sp. NJDZ02]